MCLLSYYPPGIQPHMDRLEQGARRNRDGHGYAIVTSRGTMLRRRGLEPDKILEAFEKDRRRNPEGPAIFHSRIGTSGHKKSVANCHPFEVSGDGRTMLAHNGVLFSMPAGDHRSDTRYIAETWLRTAGFSRLDKPKVRRAFEKWLGARNKVVILNVNPKYRDQSYMFNEHQGDWTDDGEWHSNDSWKVPKWQQNYGKGTPAATYTGQGGYLGTYARPVTPATPADDGPNMYGDRWRDDPRWVEEPPGSHKWHYHPEIERPAASLPAAEGEPAVMPKFAAILGPRECQVCSTPNSIHFGVCAECGCCDECLEYGDRCDCYMPENMQRERDRIVAESDMKYWEEARATESAEATAQAGAAALAPVTSAEMRQEAWETAGWLA